MQKMKQKSANAMLTPLVEQNASPAQKALSRIYFFLRSTKICQICRSAVEDGAGCRDATVGLQGMWYHAMYRTGP